MDAKLEFSKDKQLKLPGWKSIASRPWTTFFTTRFVQLFT
jgi:hypothetical protein